MTAGVTHANRAVKRRKSLIGQYGSALPATDTAEVEAQGGEPELGAHLLDADHDGVVHVAPVERVGMANDDASARAGWDREPALEDDVPRHRDGRRPFGYHARMRIRVGGPVVQRSC